MKKQNKKMILLAAMLCAVSLTICACGNKKYEPAEAVVPEVQPLGTEEDAEEETPVTEQDMENEQTDTEGTQENQSAAGDSPSTEEPKNTENVSGTESVQEDQPTVQSASGEWVERSDPNLEGSIKEMQDGQLTVAEIMIEKSDDGGDIYVSAGSGDDSSHNKITVTYDENTLFAIRTIYDGGARSELSAATSASLSSGVLVQVWGTSSGGGLKATQICIIKVA